MKNEKIKYLKFFCIVFLFFLFINLATSVSKIEETYIVENEQLPDTIPLLVMEKKEIQKGPFIIAGWDWNTNRISKGTEIPLYFKENSALLNYCRWNGNRLAVHSDFLDEIVIESDTIIDEFKTVDGSSNLVFTHLQEENYIIKCDKKELQLQLPRLTHALAGKVENNEGWLLILVEADSNMYEIKYALKLLKFDLENRDCQLTEIDNIPEQLTEFLESCVDWRNRAYDRVDCYVVDNDVFVHDKKSVYRIYTSKNVCKRIFHVSNSIPENIVNQYPDIENSYINDMGYYQGMFILEIIRNNGSSRYWYIPFLKKPVIYEQDWEEQWYAESYFPNVSG